jgi:hypothetical protein
LRHTSTSWYSRCGAVEEEDFVETLSDEDEADFVAEKKVLIRLKKFIPAVMPPPDFANKAVPIGIEPGRVPVPALVSILAPNPSIVDFGYGLQAVDTFGSVDYDNAEPIKYKNMFDVPETFEDAWNHPCPWQHGCWREAIPLELQKMLHMQVWKKVKQSSISKGR